MMKIEMWNLQLHSNYIFFIININILYCNL